VQAIPKAVVMAEGEHAAATQRATTLAFVAFTLPLFFVSIPAGVLADRISKRTLLIALKAAEAVLFAVAAVALAAGPANGRTSLVVLGALGGRRRALLPREVRDRPADRVPRGSHRGEREARDMTFLGIVLGAAAAGLSLEAAGAHVWMVPAGLALLAAAGLAALRTLPPVPVAAPPEPLVSSLGGAWRVIRKDRVLASRCWGRRSSSPSRAS
jgi:acyl-[acyl-carrier-protein]-phospholipid O-acyltransferase/long-chain-fatty-acid--[acyl-carrier-protein] ligase